MRSLEYEELDGLDCPLLEEVWGKREDSKEGSFGGATGMLFFFRVFL